MAKAPKSKADDNPDKLSRQTAGSYRTADNRFEVRQAGVGWYVVDLERANELGQELLHGPFATLKEARDEIPQARKVVQLARPKARSRSSSAKPEPPPPPETWIDRLPADDQREVRRLIAAVAAAGLADGEELVKRARSSSEPLLATALIEHQLLGLIEAGDPEDRRGRRDLVRKVLAILTDEGELSRAPLPRWELVETAAGSEKPRRLRPTV